jgi:hypothetical protein
MISSLVVEGSLKTALLLLINASGTTGVLTASSCQLLIIFPLLLFSQFKQVENTFKALIFTTQYPPSIS